MGYRENVQALADRFVVTNDPKLREQDLRIKAMKYWGQDGQPLAHIKGSEMNMAYRLFLQEEVERTRRVRTVICTEEFLSRFLDFYADVLDGTQSPEKQPALYWTQHCHRITLSRG